jgi:hypothetical protein
MPKRLRLTTVIAAFGGGLSLIAACSGGAKKPVVVEPPPRDLGPIELGPVAPEQRHVDTETYSIEVDGPPVAAVKEKVVATVTLRTKGDLVVQNVAQWRIEPKGPRDVDLGAPVLTPLQPAFAQNTVRLQVNVVPLRAGVKHIAFNLGGSVCNPDFCDVVADEVSFNLDVK